MHCCTHAYVCVCRNPCYFCAPGSSVWWNKPFFLFAAALLTLTCLIINDYSSCVHKRVFVCAHGSVCGFVCVCWKQNNIDSCSQAVITIYGFRTVSLANSSHHTALKQPDITAQRANTDLLHHNETTHKPRCFSCRFKLPLSDEKLNHDKWSVEVDRCESFPWKVGMQSAYKRWQMF